MKKTTKSVSFDEIKGKTGVDLTAENWKRVLDILKVNNVVRVVDGEYLKYFPRIPCLWLTT